MAPVWGGMDGHVSVAVFLGQWAGLVGLWAFICGHGGKAQGKVEKACQYGEEMKL